MLVKLEKEKNDLAEALEKQTADIAALEKRHYDVAHALAIEKESLHDFQKLFFVIWIFGGDKNFFY